MAGVGRLLGVSRCGDLIDVYLLFGVDGALSRAYRDLRCADDFSTEKYGMRDTHFQLILDGDRVVGISASASANVDRTKTASADEQKVASGRREAVERRACR